VSSVLDTAAEILDKVVSESGCDCRAYVHLGEIAWDGCEQITVALTGMRVGTPGASPTLPGRESVCGPVTVRAQVQRVWCVPPGDGKNPPTPDELFAAGAFSVSEAEDLWAATAEALRSIDCNGHVLGANAVGPEGGLVAWAIDIEWTRGA
jgi:hypothetical protein